MNGNPYDFNTFFQQEKVFDISGFGKILSMELSFYQKPGTFVDAQGTPIPHQGFLNKLVDNNLFIKQMDDFRNFLKNNVMLIWYEINNENNGGKTNEQLFCDINAGKIRLTNGSVTNLRKTILLKARNCSIRTVKIKALILHRF